MTFEPGAFAGARKADGQYNGALGPLGGGSRLPCRLGGFRRNFGLAGLTGWTSGSGKRRRLGGALLASAASTPASTAAAIATRWLLRLAGRAFGGGLAFLQFCLVGLRFKFRLLGFRRPERRRLRKLRL